MIFTVYWRAGSTSGCLTVRAADKTDAAEYARRKVARDFPERGPDCIQITAIDSLTDLKYYAVKSIPNIAS